MKNTTGLSMEEIKKIADSIREWLQSEKGKNKIDEGLEELEKQNEKLHESLIPIQGFGNKEFNI